MSDIIEFKRRMNRLGLPASPKRLVVETVHRKGIRRRVSIRKWEVSGDGYYRVISPARMSWIHPSVKKPRDLLEALEQVLLKTEMAGKPVPWTSSPAVRSAVIKPTASLRSQRDVDDDSR